MKLRKLQSILLSLTLIISALGSVPAAARTADVGYLITGTETGDGGFELTVSVQGANVLSGRLAIAFDSEKLELTDTSSISSAVNASGGAVVVPEGLDSTVLMSNRKGYVMFAWYSSSNTGIDADTAIATIPFRLINGASANDFSRSTIRLYYVNATMAKNWDCSAQIMTYDLASYKNNSKNDAYVCAVDYDYPNCDYVPIVTYETRLHITDYSGRALDAEVMLDNLSERTDASGDAVFNMESGVYAYRITADGYERRSGYVIADGDVTVTIPLMSYAEIVKATADSLSIGCADGDSEASVTTNISLPSEGENGEEITWQSSNSSVIDHAGAVRRGEDDTQVTLTATVSLGSARAVRSYDVTVKSRLSAEEKNAVIVSQDLTWLEIGYAPGDSQSAVTADLTLSEICPAGSSVIWVSSNEDILTANGTVTRPQSDTQVTLTAYVIRGSVSRIKEFTVTVIGESKQVYVDNKAIVNAVADSVSIIYSGSDTPQRVTEDLTLAAQGADGASIEWESSDPSVVTAYGGVIRQARDTSVTLTARIRSGSAEAARTFTVVVAAAQTTPVNPNNGQEQEIIQNPTQTPTVPTATTAPSSGIDAGGTANAGNANGTSSKTPQTGNNTTGTADTNSGDNTSGARFTDIETVPWAKEAIETLAEKGVISGVSENKFAPQDNIRRADFVILLVKLFGLDGEITSEFADVPQTAYYHDAVSLAKSLGIISGIGDNKFNPEGTITRQDMMVMTNNALEKLKRADYDSADISEFKDADDVSDYARESVSKMVGAGYIKGGDAKKLNPKNSTTRAETAVFLYQIYVNI